MQPLLCKMGFYRTDILILLFMLSSIIRVTCPTAPECSTTLCDEEVLQLQTDFIPSWGLRGAAR